MECNTCQNLYHQGCHVPPVSNDEAKDPRLIWNCMKCTRTKQPEGGEKAKLEKVERVEKVGKVASGSGAKKLSSGSKAKESRHGSGEGWQGGLGERCQETQLGEQGQGVETREWPEGWQGQQWQQCQQLQLQRYWQC